jgi:putative membrane protein insertion efficiency factor
MGIGQKVIILFVRFYQKAISPFLGPRCKFYPTCSKFCIQAVSKYGVLLGLYCTIRRILKCNPFSKGGIEYVEEYEKDRGFVLISSLMRNTRRLFLGGGPA